MIQLPFDKWTLNFNFQEQEQQYEEYQSKYRVFCFRLLTISITFLALICLIIFIVQQQPTILISFMSVFVVVTFLFLIMSRHLQKYIRLTFALCFIMSVGGGILIAISGMEIPQFTYGYSTSALAIFLLQHIHHRMKIFLTFAAPLALLGVFQIYSLQNLQFVCFAFTSAALIGIATHNNEYNSRLAFSLYQISGKQKDIIHEFVNDALFAVSLNDRTRQFELEFQNKRFEVQLNIHSSDGMKEFLRTTYITDNQGDVLKSTDTQLKKLTQKHITLEEYLFTFIKMEKGIMQGDRHSLVEVERQKDDNIIGHKISLKRISFGKPILILSIISDQVPILIDKYEQQLKNFNCAITYQSQQIAIAQKSLFSEIKNLSLNSIQAQSQSLKAIHCLSLSMINLVKNYIIYFQQDKLLALSQDFQILCLDDLINALSSFFVCLSERSNRNFTLQNFTDSNLVLKINAKFLTQILINIFEQTVKESLITSTISLVISTVFNLNPQKDRDNQQYKQPKLSCSQTGEQLIQFSFSFMSKAIIEIELLEQEQIFLNYDQEPNIQYPVTSLLLSMLGPYNTVQCKHEQIETNFHQGYLNTMYFYVYTDQSLLDTSYIKYVNKKNS